ncbi:MAG TPA: hypothetical protein VHO46_04610 [Bacteroidales bacterium]|nr:hypothetical protein [Bacteroidales bacterium]
MNNFLCPKCLADICVGNHLILKVKNQKKKSGLLLLHPQIGNYSSIKHPAFEVEEGEALYFYCPVCNASLESDIHENLIHVIMREDNGSDHDVYFSRISGEKSTFETSGDALRIAGDDAGKYTYFKLGDKFRRFL